MKIYHAPDGWQYWYDRAGGRVWWAAKFDDEGNQIGPAVHAHSKEDIIESARDSGGFLLPWTIHTPNMLRESLLNKGMEAMNIPFNIFGKLLHQVAERASQINDPILNDLMCRLTLYAIADPEQRDCFNPKIVQEVAQKANVARLKLKVS